MMDEIAKRLQFNVTYKIIDDGKYGNMDRNTGKWNGAIGEVIRGPEEGGVDFAVFDLTITSSRAEAVTFSMPFLNLGISIMFIKPRKAPPSLMSWMAPFTLEVWVWIVLGKRTSRIIFKLSFAISPLYSSSCYCNCFAVGYGKILPLRMGKQPSLH